MHEGGTTVRGLDWVSAAVRTPGLAACRIEIDDLFAAGDRVMVACTVTCTRAGTGRQLTLTGLKSYLAKRRADRDQPALSGGPDDREGLPHQAALALHQDQGREVPERVGCAAQFVSAPDEPGDAHIGTAPQAATFHASPPW